MSNVEANNNMNKAEANHKSEKQIRDVERGKGESSSSVPWVNVAVMVFAVAALAAACAVAGVFWNWQTALVVLAILVVLYVLAYFWHWLWIAAQTAPRDLKALYCYVKILRLSSNFTKKNWSMPDIFHEVVKKHPKKICFLFEDESWTFQQVEEFSLRVSAVLKAQGVKRGDTVAVMASNYPEMPATWLGIARIGGIAPLINTNQTGNTLLHSINIAHCDYVIYGSEFESAIQDIKKELSESIKLLKFTRRPLNVSNDKVKVVESDDFTHLLETTPPAPWSLSEGEGFLGRLLYIYTSGTTGLPKAAVISPSRMVFMASGVHYLGGLNPKDVIYCPMPLYHSAGGVITMGNAFIFGCTVALRLKFSASSYFPDCIKYNATAAHYIGEMCRYVLATPPSPTDRQHKVRVVYGNGMRPTANSLSEVVNVLIFSVHSARVWPAWWTLIDDDNPSTADYRAQIWNEFVKRFGIKRVSEFYGATEGNANIVNIDSKAGAIGFVSRIIPAVYPIAIIKVDEDTGEPIRDKRGLCQLAQPNEPGVFIGKIKPNNPARAFLGYVDKEASDKKIVRDVLAPGDSAFISGDILVSDELGYLYFRDRTGDTFRWRGENVSTTEVEAAISRVADQRDAVVYGVEIPDIEGRAGMCGIVDADGTLDLERLAKDIAKDLPKYARPVFIRVMRAMDMTATFKLRKVDLQKEGYDPNRVKDKLYYFDPKLNKYVSLGPEEYEKIVSGKIRL